MKAHDLQKMIDKLRKESDRCQRRSKKLMDKAKAYYQLAENSQIELDKLHKEEVKNG